MTDVMSEDRGRPRLFALTLVLLLALCAAAPAPAQITCLAEVISCGGGTSVCAAYRLHDTISQGLTGEAAAGGETSMSDGFWLVLPNVNVPVQGSCFATLTDSGTVLLRWTVGSLAEVNGFHVYRSAAAEGPFARMNDEILPAQTPGLFEDTETWPGSTFWYEVRAVLLDNSEDVVAGGATVTTGGQMSLHLYPPAPNPLRETTTIVLDVPDHTGPVNLMICNARGQRVRTIWDESLKRGRHELVWDGRNSSGRTTSSGIYFVRLDVGGRSEMRKILVLR